jgi:osmotically-inducible protein OsmY
MIRQMLTEERGRGRSRAVTEAARNRLKESPHWAIRSLTCECYDGVLFLRGHLPCFYQKQLAQEAVGKLEGVLQVINETVVDAPVRKRR